MRTIIHLSDLHFGKIEKARVLPLVDFINTMKPDLIVVSGDLTQRATVAEYKEAKNFLKKLKRPKLVVPGNHDIPFYNIFTRSLRPFKKYATYISDDLSPVYHDKEMTVVGINSARPYTITSGRISKKQIEETEKAFDEASPQALKIVVCHHPFDLPTADVHHKHTHKVIAESVTAVKRLASKKVDLFLAGHLHVTHIGDTTARYKIKNYSGIIVQAGTALSRRVRGELVSFNVIHIDNKYVQIDCYRGLEKASGYALAATHKYKKGEVGWKILE